MSIVFTALPHHGLGRRATFRKAARQFEDACVRNAQADVSIRQQGNRWIIYRSRLLDGDVNNRSAVLEYPSPRSGQELEPIKAGASITVSVTQAQSKMIFTASIVELTDHAFNENVTLQAMVVSLPDKLRKVDRRSLFRAKVPSTKPLRMQLWEGGPKNRPGPQSQWKIHTAFALDISAGGISVGK